MQRLVAFFKDIRVLTFIGLVALSLVVWFGADYVRFGAEAKPLSEMGRLIVIMVLLVLWGLNNLRIAQRDKRQNNQLVQGIKDAAKSGANSGDQQIGQEEAAAIQERFQDALNRLKQSKFQTSNGSKTLYELPWYIMVGPPGSGKTTAIVNSGLSFPLAGSMGTSKVGGVGGTRNCDWWFTNEAVLIDTAGRYTTQDSHAIADSQGWQSFLGLLKKYRPRRPVNGVIVAISVQDLIVQTREERSLHAKTIRARLDELMQQLGMGFPIYLNFTKCDLIAGFSEFFDDLGQGDREQVWGMTFPPASAPGAAAPADFFGGEFDALLDRLNKRLLSRVHSERDVRRRQSISLFPQQFENLKQNLQDFIQETFAPSRYHQQPELRGVYFSSATQEGTPIDRIMASLASNFGLGREAVQTQGGQGKAYFIGDLLNKVVFPEAELAGINNRYEKRLKLLRYGAFAGLFGVFVLALGVWAATVHQNSRLMGEMSAKIKEYEAARAQLTDTSGNPSDVLAVLNPLREASAIYEQVSHPWLSGLGLYDSSVDGAANDAYSRALVSLFLPRLGHELERNLGAQNEDDSLFETLRVYLMLNLIERREADAIRDWAVTHWSRTLKGQASVQAELATHLDTLLAQGFGSLPLKDNLVASAREQLRRVPIEQRIYAHLKAEMTQPRLELLPVLGSMERSFSLTEPGLFSVPFLYTKNGYGKVDLSRNSPAVVGLTRDRWVMGQTTEGEDFSEQDLDEIGQRVREIYLNDYGNYWATLLESVRAKSFGGMTDAVERLGLLADPQYSPISLFLGAVAENTQLTPDVPDVPVGAGKAGQAADALSELAAPKILPPTVVDKRFRDINNLSREGKGQPAQIARILSQIGNLKNYLAEITLAPEPSAMAFEKAKARFQGGSDPVRDLTLLANETPVPVKNWLAAMALEGWQVTVGASGQHLGKLWRNDVYGRYSKALANRFPFDSNSRDDAAMSDFIEFFKPGGTEQEFFNTYLKPFVNTQGARWTLRTLDRSGVNISAAALQQMQLADQIRRTYFQKGDAPDFSFRLTPIRLDPGVRLFELDLGGQSVRYTHGPKIPSDAKWPSAQDSVRILFQDLNETNHSKRYDGEWAFFRLLGDSKVEKSGRANSFLLSFSTGGREAQYELTARSQVNPLNRDLLSSYRCPESL